MLHGWGVQTRRCQFRLGLCDPDIVRASEFKHPVQGGSSDGDFRGFGLISSRSKGIVDYAFVSTDCCLDLGPKIVATRLLPAHPTTLDDLLDVSVPLCRSGRGGRARDCGCARRHNAGVAGPPILDWFHIAMRLQHLKHIAGGLSADDPQRVAAKAAIVAEVERLHWRLWNGKAKNARTSIDRIRAVMHHFRGEQGRRKSIAPARKLWTALQALAGQMAVQSDWNGQLRPAPPCRLAGWHRDHRRDGQFPGEPPDEQIAADALVAARGRSPPAGSLCRLQWHAGFRLRTEIPASQRSGLRDNQNLYSATISNTSLGSIPLPERTSVKLEAAAGGGLKGQALLRFNQEGQSKV